MSPKAGAVGGPLQLGADHGRESRDRATRRLVSDPVGRPGTREAGSDRRRGANDLRQTLLDSGEGRACTGDPPKLRKILAVDDVDVDVQVEIAHKWSIQRVTHRV